MNRFCAFLILANASCAGGAPQAEEIVQSLVLYVSVSDPILRGAYEAAQVACQGERSCVERVRREWAPIIDVAQRAREIWCSIKPEDCKEE